MGQKMLMKGNEAIAEAAEQARAEGMEQIYTFALPDYHEEDCGARNHPNAEWNRMAGEKLGAYLQTLL